jgi:hypothetical protein
MISRAELNELIACSREHDRDQLARYVEMQTRTERDVELWKHAVVSAAFARARANAGAR